MGLSSAVLVPRMWPTWVSYKDVKHQIWVSELCTDGIGVFSKERSENSFTLQGCHS